MSDWYVLLVAMAPKGDKRDTERGRGRPTREPVLWPADLCTYDAWFAVWSPYLDRLLRACDAEQLEWDEYERKEKAATKARATGLTVELVERPVSLFASVKATTSISAADRPGVVAVMSRMRQRMPTGESQLEITLWLLAAVLARGLVCDYRSAYQVWTVYAELLLRDADIGAIIRGAHPERFTDRPARLDEATERAFNARLASAERKRMNAQRSAFGYATA